MEVSILNSVEDATKDKKYSHIETYVYEARIDYLDKESETTLFEIGMSDFNVAITLILHELAQYQGEVTAIKLLRRWAVTHTVTTTVTIKEEILV